MAAELKTKVSAKGQVLLPKSVRDALCWGAGTELTIEKVGDEIRLKAARLFPRTRLEDVLGSLKYTGPAVTLAEMDQSVLDEARRQYLAIDDPGD